MSNINRRSVRQTKITETFALGRRILTSKDPTKNEIASLRSPHAKRTCLLLSNDKENVSSNVKNGIPIAIDEKSSNSFVYTIETLTPQSPGSKLSPLPKKARTEVVPEIQTKQDLLLVGLPKNSRNVLESLDDFEKKLIDPIGHVGLIPLDRHEPSDHKLLSSVSESNSLSPPKTAMENSGALFESLKFPTSPSTLSTSKNSPYNSFEQIKVSNLEIDEKLNLEAFVPKEKTEFPEINKELIHTHSQTTSEDSFIIPYDAKSVEDILGRQAAHERFAHLSKPKGTLPLPSHFTLLQSVMSALDGLCILAAQRDQPVIFHRVKSAIEIAVGRRMGIGHLMALEKINPHLYITRPAKMICDGKKITSTAIEMPPAFSQQNSPTFHKDLMERKEALAIRMIGLVHENHSVFLTRSNIVLPKKAKLRSWHPDFNLDTVPPVPEDLEASFILNSSIKSLAPHQSDLVQTPNAIDVKNFESETSPPSSTCELDIKEPDHQVKHDAVINLITDTVEAKSPPAVTREEPKKMSLLDRIKARERETKISQIVITEEKTSKEDLLSFSASIALLFAQMPPTKSTIMIGDAVTRLSQGSRSPISPAEIVEKLERVARVLPMWLVLGEAAQGTLRTLRINRSLPFSKVRQFLN